MTPQEIDRIQCAIRHIKTSVDVDEWAMEIAVDAMQKQIPKEPVYKKDDIYVKSQLVELPHCPTCNWEVSTGDMHCFMCGQAIDWGDEG